MSFCRTFSFQTTISPSPPPPPPKKKKPARARLYHFRAGTVGECGEPNKGQGEKKPRLRGVAESKATIPIPGSELHLILVTLVPVLGA